MLFVFAHDIIALLLSFCPKISLVYLHVFPISSWSFGRLHDDLNSMVRCFDLLPSIPSCVGHEIPYLLVMPHIFREGRRRNIIFGYVMCTLYTPNQINNNSIRLFVVYRPRVFLYALVLALCLVSLWLSLPLLHTQSIECKVRFWNCLPY